MLQNSLLATAYSGHVQNATVARISPSGYYCASADVSGTGGLTSSDRLGAPSLITSLVRVWDTMGEDQTLKGEYKVISGRMYVVSSLLAFLKVHCPLLSNDLEWDGESKRIIAVGDGREK